MKRYELEPAFPPLTKPDAAEADASEGLHTQQDHLISGNMVRSRSDMSDSERDIFDADGWMDSYLWSNLILTDRGLLVGKVGFTFQLPFHQFRLMVNTDLVL